MFLYDSRIYSSSLKNQTLYFSSAEVGKREHLNQSINQSSNQAIDSNSLSIYWTPIIGWSLCLELGVQRSMESNSCSQEVAHVSIKKNKVLSVVRELLKHTRIRRRIMKMMTREMNLEKRVGSLHNRTHGVFWEYQDILLDLREKIGKK